MAVAGLYRRRLPSPPAIEFASAEGKAIFREALEHGTMEGFFHLIAHFQTQAEPAFCGLASLAVILNALAIDPGRTWKGPWRWFDESMLECCEPLEKVKEEGITFAKVACAGQCAGAEVQGIRASTSSLEEFRQHVLECSTGGDRHMIVSYDRRILGQTGSGHFSPLGGYNQERDLALILDVARFKYPPHWVPLSILWDAVNTIDPATGNCRGFLLASKPERPASVLFTLSCKDERWRPIANYLIEEVPQLLSSGDWRAKEEVLSVSLGLMPGDVTCFLKWVAEVKRADTLPAKIGSEAAGALHAKAEVLSQLRLTTLYKMVREWASGLCSSCPAPCPFPSLAGEDLPEAVKNACCQGAAALSGMLGLSAKGCKGASVTTRLSDSTEATMVVGNVSLPDGTQDIVDILVPTVPSGKQQLQPGTTCVCLHPASADLLTMLVFALPTSTWRQIQNATVQKELADDVSTVNLPTRLKVEVENLREQLYIVYRWCNDGDIEADFKMPPVPASPTIGSLKEVGLIQS